MRLKIFTKKIIENTKGAAGKLLAAPHMRKAVIGLLLLVISIAYAHTYLGGALTVFSTKRELPVYNVATDEKKLSISFDAAWGSANTDKLLDILDAYNIKTTFFLVGIWVDKYPELVKEFVDRGHEIGNHSTTHPHMTQVSESKMREELKLVSDKVEEITGIRPTLFRPPYGDYNNAVVRVARDEGYEVVQWNVDSLDWKNLGADNMIRQCTKSVHPGDIVLFHNDSQFIIDALPTILKFYTEAGYEIVPVSELVLPPPYTIDHMGTQHPA